MKEALSDHQRSYHLDLAAGILMLWIITFHAVNGAKVFGPVDARVVIPFLTFSMPWFFYKSGAFFQENRGRKGLERDVRKLLLPYLRWTALGYLAYLVMMAIDGTFTLQECVFKPLDTLWIYGYLPLDVPVWFVLSLFVTKVIAHFLFKLRIPPVIILVVGFVIPFVLHEVGNPRIPVWLSNISMGLGFFALGFLLHRWEDRQWLFLPCLAGYMAFLMFDTPVVGLHRNVHLGGCYYLWPLFSVCGIVMFNNMCRALGQLVEKNRRLHFRPVSFIGRHSILLLVSHAFVYMPVLHYSQLSPIQTFLLIEGIYFLILLPLLFVAGQKKGGVGPRGQAS